MHLHDSVQLDTSLTLTAELSFFCNLQSYN